MSRKRSDFDGTTSDESQDELPPIPTGWCWTPLDQISQIAGGITKDQKRRQSPSAREVPYLRVANVQRGFLDLTELKTIVADADEIEVLRLRHGDVLFTEGGDRDKLGRGWVWSGELDECIHQNHIFRARPNSEVIDPKFLSFHGNHFGRDWFARTGKQTTNLASINKGVLSRFPVPVAPLAEQRRIVAKIEELFSDLDAGVAALERVRANLKRYRAAVLKAAVEGKLTEDWRAQHPDTEPASVLLDRILTDRRRQWEADQLAKFAEAGKQPPKGWQHKIDLSSSPEDGLGLSIPDSWCWTTVSSVGEVRLGRQRSPANHQGPHMRPYLRVANVYEDRLDLSDVMEMNFSPKEFETYNLKPWDILLNEGQSIELVGRAAMYRGEVPGACFQNTLVRFRARDEVLPEFALLVFRAYLRNQRFQRIARWTVNIAHLGADRFSNMGFPLPPLAEQQRIVDELETTLTIVDNVEAQVAANLKRAARLRQGILKRAFEGRLVPQDPADEPAAALLERLRSAPAVGSGSEPGSRTRPPRSPGRPGRRPRAPGVPSDTPLFDADPPAGGER